MAAVNFHSGFGTQENKICDYFQFFPFCLPRNDGIRCHDLSSLMISFKPAFYSMLSPSSRSPLVPLLLLFFFFFSPLERCHLLSWDCWYVSQQYEFQLVIHSAQDLHGILCIYVNKQDNNIQPCHIPSSVLNQSVVPCLVLTVASWPTCMLLRRQVRWSAICISKNFLQS